MLLNHILQSRKEWNGIHSSTICGFCRMREHIWRVLQPIDHRSSRDSSRGSSIASPRELCMCVMTALQIGSIFKSVMVSSLFFFFFLSAIIYLQREAHSPTIIIGLYIYIPFDDWSMDRKGMRVLLCLRYLPLIHLFSPQWSSCTYYIGSVMMRLVHTSPAYPIDGWLVWIELVSGQLRILGREDLFLQYHPIKVDKLLSTKKKNKFQETFRDILSHLKQKKKNNNNIVFLKNKKIHSSTIANLPLTTWKRSLEK